MRTTLTPSSVTRGQLVMATVLLLGILEIGYGYFQQSKIGLYVGLLITAAGVLNGVLQIVMQGHK